MVSHIVLFKPKPSLPAETRHRLIEAFGRALRDIPAIRRASVGKRITHGRPYEQLMTVDYEYAAILEFDDDTQLKTYLEHEAHVALGTMFFEAFEVALMYDYEMKDGETGLADLA